MKSLLDRKTVSNYSLKAVFCTIYFHRIVAGSTDTEDKRFLRCAMISIPPFDTVTYYPNGTSSSKGCSSRNVEWLAAKLKYSQVFLFNVSWLAIISYEILVLNMFIPLLYTQKKEEMKPDVDFMGNALAISSERYPRVDVETFPIWEEPHRLVVPRPAEQDRLFAFIKPFTPTVWLLLGLSFLVVSLFMGLLTWISSRYRIDSNVNISRNNNRASNHLSKYFLFNVNVLTNHGDYLSESRTSFLLGVTFWLLGASVLVYSYSSIVVSSITLPQMEPSIDSLEDVASHPDISLILRTDTYIGSVINSNTRSPLYKTLREKAAKRPESIGSEGIVNPAKLILTGKYAYTFIDTPVRFMVSNLYTKEGKCKYQMSRSLALWDSQFYLFFAKGNRQLVREFSIGAMYYWEVGLIRHCIRSLPVNPKSVQCYSKFTERQSARRITSIKLVDLTSAFFILGVGVGIALVSFLLEVIFSRRTNGA